MLATDSARPRLTCYDDTPGPSQGERVELSARVLANWVAKAANMLQDDLDAAPATTVGLDLPAHWRAFYWALATWSVGATLVVGPGASRADVVVTTDHRLAARIAQEAGLAVLVTLPMLARVNLDTGAEVVDEARELATHGDVFAAWEEADARSVAVDDGVGPDSYADVVVSQPDWGSSPRVRVPDRLGPALRAALSAWAADGSVVLVIEPDGDQSARLTSEGVTLDLS